MEEFVSSQNFNVVVCNAGLFPHKIFDIIEVLVYFVEAIGSGLRLYWTLEVA